MYLPNGRLTCWLMGFDLCSGFCIAAGCLGTHKKASIGSRLLTVTSKPISAAPHPQGRPAAFIPIFELEIIKECVAELTNIAADLYINLLLFFFISIFNPSSIPTITERNLVSVDKKFEARAISCFRIDREAIKLHAVHTIDTGNDIHQPKSSSLVACLPTESEFPRPNNPCAACLQCVPSFLHTKLPGFHSCAGTAPVVLEACVHLRLSTHIATIVRRDVVREMPMVAVGLQSLRRRGDNSCRSCRPSPTPASLASAIGLAERTVVGMSPCSCLGVIRGCR